MEGHTKKTPTGGMPGWVPQAAMHYLRHTEQGLSIREVARAEGCHASTILRRIRRFEQRRDDPLVDEALSTLGARHFRTERSNRHGPEEPLPMTAHFPMPADTPKAVCDEATVTREARRILRRLSESGAVLAVAADMEKAAVLREMPDGRTNRTAVVDRAVAQAFALKEWITCRNPGRVASYTITAAGRSALKRLLGADAGPGGFSEAATPFGDQHRQWGSKVVLDTDDNGEPRRRRVRYNMAESPVVALARRREKDGTPFLEPGQVAAAERLREDFELSVAGPGGHADWEAFLLAAAEEETAAAMPQTGGAAGERVRAALEALGPGLADVALRCCCLLEGLESLERRMGWSARSGKVVLRIALQRLNQHYLRTQGRFGPLIG